MRGVRQLVGTRLLDQRAPGSPVPLPKRALRRGVGKEVAHGGSDPVTPVGGTGPS